MVHRCLILISVVLLAGCATRLPDTARVAAAEAKGLCWLHHTPLAKTIVPVTYGLIALPDNARGLAARAGGFPYARRAVYGGCSSLEVVGSPGLSSPRFAEIPICPQCDVARAHWVIEHPSNPWARIWKYSTDQDRLPGETKAGG